MTNAMQVAQRLGQSIWYDNIRRGGITSGELARLIELGITGVTSNLGTFEKTIAGSSDYDPALLNLALRGKTAGEALEALVVEDVRAAADLLRPVFDRTGGGDGYASLEVNPHLAHDSSGTVAEARRLFTLLDRPNIMVKVPATPEGITAIRRLIGQGINVKVTLVFSLDTYQKVQEAYIAGLEDMVRNGGDVSRVASVASFFVSRLDTAVDALLEERIRQEATPAGKAASLHRLLGKAAVANSRLAYLRFKEIFNSGGGRFTALRTKGARRQRPLWASTGTKNPNYSDILYVESLIGPDTVNTVSLGTLTAFLDHGRPKLTLEQRIEESHAVIRELGAHDISVKGVTARLHDDGVKASADSYDKLLATVEAKQARLLAGGRPGVRSALAPAELLPAHQPPTGEEGGPAAGSTPDSPGAWDYRQVEEALAGLESRDVVARIWRKDHTVWRTDPTEIANRLGWLNTTEQMRELLPALEAFAAEVRSAGFRHVVLLGMGGSSLGPEVLRQVLGSASRPPGTPSPRNQEEARQAELPNYPTLIMLDSTVPASVRAVSSQIHPARTLFLVSSKSGASTETTSFYRYFRGLVEQAVGGKRAGRSFVAITDRGTPLQKLAQDEGFRCIFLNSPEIGGRYSVLSYFGLVPAVLTGIDVGTLLDRADCMREACASCVPVRENPGASLGATIGVLARQGRDKLTLLTPPPLESFGLWVEQLLAESLGKDGKGIIPVAGEPWLEPGTYGRDRLFVYWTMAGADSAANGKRLDRLAAAGHPVLRLELKDRYDLGAEFFRWELATSVAGSLLGVHPFDQPDVQGSKDNTDRVLEGFRRDGRLPPMADTGNLSELLGQAQPGDYLAIMAYTQQNLEVEGLLTELRRRVGEQLGIATTLGYGPRFLHSTGPLHKGGPATGLYLQLTADYPRDAPIPGQEYDFGVLATAQAIGDFGALRSLGRRAVRVHLGGDPARGLRRLLEDL